MTALGDRSSIPTSPPSSSHGQPTPGCSCSFGPPTGRHWVESPIRHASSCVSSALFWIGFCASTTRVQTWTYGSHGVRTLYLAVNPFLSFPSSRANFPSGRTSTSLPRRCVHRCPNDSPALLRRWPSELLLRTLEISNASASLAQAHPGHARNVFRSRCGQTRQ